jgi:hypothetical protein
MIKYLVFMHWCIFQNHAIHDLEKISRKVSTITPIYPMMQHEKGIDIYWPGWLFKNFDIDKRQNTLKILECIIENECNVRMSFLTWTNDGNMYMIRFIFGKENRIEKNFDFWHDYRVILGPFHKNRLR